MRTIHKATSIPPDWLPYQNRWGNWCWRRLDIAPDMTWPGIKSPTEDCWPALVEGQWVWAEGNEPSNKSLAPTGAIAVPQEVDSEGSLHRKSGGDALTHSGKVI